MSRHTQKVRLGNDHVNGQAKLTPPQVAERFGVSPESVIAWIRKRELRAIDVSARPGVGRPRFRIDPVDLAAFEASREVVGVTTPRRRKRKAVGITEYFQDPIVRRSGGRVLTLFGE